MISSASYRSRRVQDRRRPPILALSFARSSPDSWRVPCGTIAAGTTNGAGEEHPFEARGREGDLAYAAAAASTMKGCRQSAPLGCYACPRRLRSVLSPASRPTASNSITGYD
jgi:hypothetical protein